MSGDDNLDKGSGYNSLDGSRGGSLEGSGNNTHDRARGNGFDGTGGDGLDDRSGSGNGNDSFDGLGDGKRRLDDLLFSLLDLDRKRDLVIVGFDDRHSRGNGGDRDVLDGGLLGKDGDLRGLEHGDLGSDEDGKLADDRGLDYDGLLLDNDGLGAVVDEPKKRRRSNQLSIPDPDRVISTH